LNPYALDRDPGASSSGSGAGTAANLGAVSLGTDCGGSIRVPASFGNLVGIRSTPGLISRNGVGCLIFFQDTIGPMTRTVTDAATVFDTLVGYDPADSLTAAYKVARAPETYTASLAGDGLQSARLGLVTNALGSSDNEFAAPVNDVIRQALGSIEQAGATVVEVEIPDLAHHIGATLLYVNRTKFDINSFLGARPNAPVRSLNQLIESRRYDPNCDLLEQCGFGPDRPEYDPMYYQRLAAREEFARATQNVLAGNRLDALIYPSVQVVPPRIRDCDEGMWPTLAFPTNTLIASQTWMPAISVPAGFTDEGLPVGLEITSFRYAEPTLFRLAYAFEQATHHRRAPTCAPELAG
jgi:amidase